MHRPWIDDELACAPVLVMAALAGEVPDDALRTADGEPIADREEWMQAHRERLADYVFELYEYWTLKRKLGAAVSPKLGRNDPCPCGSGKKHKKCCLQ